MMYGTETRGLLRYSGLVECRSNILQVTPASVVIAQHMRNVSWPLFVTGSHACVLRIHHSFLLTGSLRCLVSCDTQCSGSGSVSSS